MQTHCPRCRTPLYLFGEQQLTVGADGRQWCRGCVRAMREPAIPFRSRARALGGVEARRLVERRRVVGVGG